MNVYQLALAFRQYYAGTGISEGAVEDMYTNTYFIFHDSLHWALGQRPEQQFEPLVLSAELLFGGKDILPNVDIDTLTSLIAGLNPELVEVYIDFYTNWFNQ